MRRFVCLLVSMSAACAALAGEWRAQDGSELLFEATWEGTPVPGRFEAFDVRLDGEGNEIANSTLTVTVNLDGADMDDPDINEAIAGDDWFAVATHPVARYTSDTIEPVADGAYLASGHLELKGLRLPVDVPFQWSESDDSAEMSGELTIDRTRFEVGSGEWATGETIGTEVRVSFRVVLERQ